MLDDSHNDSQKGLFQSIVVPSNFFFLSKRSGVRQMAKSLGLGENVQVQLNR